MSIIGMSGAECDIDWSDISPVCICAAYWAAHQDRVIDVLYGGAGRAPVRRLL